MLFRAFDDERVLHHADGVLVVNKPAGVPCQAPGDIPEDLPARLKTHLGLDYLGVHQRLDSGTSGCIAYASERSANQRLKGALERGEKRYVAAVELGPSSAIRRWKDGWQEVEHILLTKGGRSQVVPKARRGTKVARARMRVRAREGTRALIDVQLKTGRTHQIRAQLSALDAPVAGDGLYGDVRAERMMLHADQLTLDGAQHRAALPAAFSRFMAGDSRLHAERIGEVVRAVAERRYGLHLDAHTNAFRLLHGDAEGAPGVNIDVYGSHWVMHLVSDDAHREEARLSEGLRRAFGEQCAGLYVKRRPKQANVLIEGSRQEAAPPEPLWGQRAEAFFVRESAMPIEVHLGEALSTGVFLDQRKTRAKVHARASGLRVLNLFSYTCAFGMAAAMGGADEVVNVDASGPALGRGKRNFAEAGVSGRFLKDDVFLFLAREARRNRSYDLILCDPPTYARGKKRRWKSGAQWKDLVAECAALAAPGATLLLSSNDARMAQGTFRRYVREGAENAGRRVLRLLDEGPQRDFPVPAGEDPLPRRVWLTLD